MGAQHMRFELRAVVLAIWQRLIYKEIRANERFARLSFSFIDLLVGVLTPVEELLCGT